MRIKRDRKLASLIHQAPMILWMLDAPAAAQKQLRPVVLGWFLALTESTRG